MNRFSFEVVRNQRGELEAETDIPMSAPGRVLRFNTSKGYKGLRCYVQAGILYRSEGNTSGFVGFKMVMFGEFGKSFDAGGKRATEKAIRELHAAVLEKADELMAEAEAFYANGGKKPHGFAVLEPGEIAYMTPSGGGMLVASDPEADRAKAIAAFEAGALEPKTLGNPDTVDTIYPLSF